MEVSLRAPCKTDHFHFTLVKTVELKALPRKGSVYPHLWSRLRFRVEEVIHLQARKKPVVILEALPGSLQAFEQLVNKVTAPVPILRDRPIERQVDGWAVLPGSQGPDLFTKEQWERIRMM